MKNFHAHLLGMVLLLTPIGLYLILRLNLPLLGLSFLLGGMLFLALSHAAVVLRTSSGGTRK